MFPFRIVKSFEIMVRVKCLTEFFRKMMRKKS